MQSFINELLRRNLIRVAGAYAVVGWVLIQLSIALETSLHLPNWFDSLVTSLVFLGFPVAMVLTWALEMAPDQAEGPNPSATKRSWRVADIGVMVGVFLIVALMAWQALTAAPIGSTAAPMQDAALDQDSNAIAQNDDARSVADHLSIAVLPFEDFSIEGDQAYFANGIAEEILNTLAQVQGLTVTSRASSFTFQDRETPLREIGEALNVAHVLDGSVRKSGNQLRITAQLIDTNTDVNVWSGTYDRPLSLDNIFAIQDEIALQIVEALRSELALPGNAAEQRPTSLEAYQLYLRGREQMHRRQPESLAAARQDFERVIELDPGFAPAYAGMADITLLLSTYSGTPVDEAISEARTYLIRAIELAPLDPDTLTAQAHLDLVIGGIENFFSARHYAETATQINPNSAAAFQRLGEANMAIGLYSEGLEAFERLVELDPLSPIFRMVTGVAYRTLGQVENAERQASMLAVSNNGSLNATWLNGWLAADDGALAEAYLIFREGFERDPAHAYISSAYFRIALSLGLDPDLGNLTKLQQSYLELARSDFEAALATFSDGTDISFSSMADPISRILLPYLGKDFSLTTTIFEDWTGPGDNWFSVSPGWGGRTGMWAAAADAYRRTQHPDAEAVLGVLERHFQNYPIQRTQLAEQYFDKAVMHVLRGEDELSLDSLDAFVAAGHVSPWLEIYPAFDSLRELPRYQAVVAANDQNAARHRADIEALQSVERSQH